MKKLLCAMLVVGLAVPVWAGVTSTVLERIAARDSVPYLRDAASFALDIKDDYAFVMNWRDILVRVGDAAYIKTVLEDADFFAAVLKRAGVEEDLMLMAWKHGLGAVLFAGEYNLSVSELEALVLEGDEDAALALAEALILAGDAEAVWQRLALQLTNPEYADADLLVDAYVYALGFLWAAGL